MPKDAPTLPTKPPAPSGTYNLWIDSTEHPDAFEPGIRQRWGSFPLGEETCVVCSDGPTLAATVRMEAENRANLFRVPIQLPKTRRRHLITIGWSKGSMKILLDSKLITEVPLTFILWLLSVSGVLWFHR